jgi:RNAse (barnase) inhibitor barstar
MFPPEHDRDQRQSDEAERSLLGDRRAHAPTPARSTTELGGDRQPRARAARPRDDGVQDRGRHAHLPDQREILAADVSELEHRRFVLRRFTCSAWQSDDDMYRDLRLVLALPDYFGCNLNVLADVLEDLDVPETGGMAFVLDDYDGTRDRDEGLLSVLARSARLLFGRLQPVLVRTDDPHYRSAEDLGATPAQWNRHEWLQSARAD